MSDEDLFQFVVAAPYDGGLALTLPGEYYETMRMHARSLLLRIHTRQLCAAHFESTDYIMHRFSHPQVLPIQVAIPFTDMLEDDELKALLDMRFGHVGYQPERCPICGKPPGHHQPKCAGYMRQVWGVHNDILRLLISFMHGKRHAIVRQEKLQNDDRYYWSDGSFIGDDHRTYQIDVSVVWNGSPEKRYEEKMKHTDQPDLFIPFIVMADGHVMQESIDRLRNQAPEMTSERIVRAVTIPLAKRAAERARTVSKHTLAGTSAFLPETSGLSEEFEGAHRISRDYPAIFAIPAALAPRREQGPQPRDQDSITHPGDQAQAQPTAGERDSATVISPAALAKQTEGQAGGKIASASQSHTEESPHTQSKETSGLPPTRKATNGPTHLDSTGSANTSKSGSSTLPKKPPTLPRGSATTSTRTASQSLSATRSQPTRSQSAAPTQSDSTQKRPDPPAEQPQEQRRASKGGVFGGTHLQQALQAQHQKKQVPPPPRTEEEAEARRQRLIDNLNRERERVTQVLMEKARRRQAQAHPPGGNM